MPGKTPSPHKSRSPSPKRKSASPKTTPSPGGRKSSSPGRKKSPGHGDKSPSPGRRSGSGKGKTPTSGTGDESAPASASKKKNVVIKTPELTERGLKVVDYSGQGMTVIPASLLSTKDVGVLILASNNLRSLPMEVRRMKSLIRLDISRNGIRCTHPGDFSGLPQELESLTDLEELKISECNLPYVPPTIWRLTQLRALDLSRNKINILPPEVGQLVELRRLNLQQTNITSLPPEIAYCQELEEVLLWGNSIETLPDTLPEMPKLRVLALNYRSFCGVVDPYMENLLRKRQINSEHIPVVVFELPALEVLDLESTKLNNLPDVYTISLKEFYLCRNFLHTIPPTIYNLRYLQVLDMSFNLLMTLPEDIGRLRSLKVLRLNNNSFERVPPTLGHLESLVELNMAKNRIRRLPSEIRGLKELRTLILEDNDLQSLPDEICELTNLETLDVTKNSIRVLPLKLYKLVNLKEAHGFRKLTKHGLWLYQNPLEQPPPEVWRTEKPENIYSYLKKLLIIKTENLQRQKILVLGNSQAGKTSLVRVLAQGKSSLTAAMADRTRLMEQTPCKTENNVAFMLHDFGGDDAYRMMHHLFLDRKALAMIVYDANTFREENYQEVIGRWLQMLTAFSPGVVVKLVGTKCDTLEHDEGEDVPNHCDVVCQLVKRHLQEHRRKLQAELEVLEEDLTKFGKSTEGKEELSDAQASIQQMLQARKDRLNDILACPLRVLPKVSSVSATDSLEGVRELVSDLEHLAIDRSLFPHAQRKVPQHWNRLRANLKLQSGYYLLWDHVEQTAALFGIHDDELKECVQYYCDTGEVLWYESINGLSEIVFHRPRVLVDLLSCLYRHDVHHYLQFPDNKVFYSKGHLTEEGFNVSRDLFLQYGQLSRPLLNCLWFHEGMSQDTLTDLLELLPLLDLCYTIPEPDSPTLPLHQRPLMVLPFYNQDTDLTPLAEVWPESPPTHEKSLRVIYHFPVVFPFGVFQQIAAAIQDMVMTRMDWRDVIFATTETEKVLVWRNLSQVDEAGTLMLAVRGADFSLVQDLMQDLMEQVTDLLKRFPGLYWKVDVQGSNINTFLKVM
ncbi:LOW QUALITY PROTEIN: malignant fibrous histiocytoma-amplified sequence 1 homolog [Babylonia areolata]|uniref:LOW QUALITY PROTEIN: malignant fibrous histiocytoma-amplified sequence 1 homolog n=1 Tax=Babylonia areolata TaxID=304850 RepID=UPI003FCFA006